MLALSSSTPDLQRAAELVRKAPNPQQNNVEPETGFQKYKSRRRRRRHRTSKAKHSQPEGDASTQSSQLSEFAHIRVVRKPEPAVPPQQTNSPQPVFRNPSLTLETEPLPADDPPSGPRPSSSGESLAYNPRGVTFAARARAAELQAARARRELNTRDTNISPPHEIMTFKKGAKKKWNPLDLSTLPDPAQSPIDDLPETFQSSARANSGPGHEEVLSLLAQKKQNEKENMVAGQNIMQPAFTDMFRAEPESDAEYAESSPCPSVPRGFGSYDPVKKAVSSAPVTSMTPGQLAIARTPRDSALEASSSLTVPSDSNWNMVKTARIIKAQETQIANLTAQLRAQNVENLRAVPSRQVEDPPQMPRSSQPSASSLRHGDGLKIVPQKQYPAVKGTTDNTMRPTLSIRPPPGFVNPVIATRRASEDEKAFLLRRLNVMVEPGSSNRQLLVATEAGTTIDAPTDRRQLVEDSEPLPWKDRRVPIKFDQLTCHSSRIEPPKTPPGQSTFPVFDSPDRSPEKKSREEELEDWWTRDNRIDLRFKAELDEYMKNVDAKRLERKKADKAALQAANFSDERNDVNQSKDLDFEEEGALCRSLLLPVLANLYQYRSHPRGEFDRFAPPPSWSIDHTPQGNDSFFSQGWGIPPSRVGRDPRYRTVQHDGRSSVFEDPTGKWPREEYNRHAWW